MRYGGFPNRPHRLPGAAMSGVEKDGGAATRSAHQAETILMIHLQDPGSTIASVGVIYGLCIAARPRLHGDAWERVHRAIRERFKPKDDAAWMRLRDKINKAGWKLHDDLVDEFAVRGDAP